MCWMAWVAALAFGIGAAAQGNWPEWRGPTQNGIGEATNLPEAWSDTENIVWKTPLPSWSGGTPVIWGDRIFLTSPSQVEGESLEPVDGRRRDISNSPGGQKLLLICIGREDGTILWQRELDEGNKLRRKQNDSSPSPVTDGAHVWAIAGTGALVAFDMAGERVWSKNLQTEYGAFGQQFGYASSPILYNGKLVLQVLHGFFTDDPSYVLALDALTGAERWRQERPTDAVVESPDSYTTPVLLRHEDKVQVVISGGDYVTGHDPDSGAEIWRAGGLNPKKITVGRIIASPVAVGGMVYAPSRKEPVLALRAGGVGDITTSHLAWKWDANDGPDVPTPACDGTYFYMVDDRGVITCLDAKTGSVIWGPERTARGTVSASPLVADGKIYITNEDAVTTVLAAGPAFKTLSTNPLDGEYTLSSPVVSGNRLFIRTALYLYCIGKKTP